MVLITYVDSQIMYYIQSIVQEAIYVLPVNQHLPILEMGHKRGQLKR